MSEKRVLLEAAAFLDSPQALALRGVAKKDAREIAQRFLTAAYDDCAKAPRLLEGDDLVLLLHRHLPRRYERADRLGPSTGTVLAALLDWLEETEVVPYAFELRQRLLEHLATFEGTVLSGAALDAEGAVRKTQRTVRFRADKVGRNDPCPCGSGKKFKRCCMPLGGDVG